MQEAKLLKATGQDQIAGIFSVLEQTVERGASVTFSFPAPGCVVMLCSMPKVRGMQGDCSKPLTGGCASTGTREKVSLSGEQSTNSN